MKDCPVRKRLGEPLPMSADWQVYAWPLREDHLFLIEDDDGDYLLVRRDDDHPDDDGNAIIDEVAGPWPTAEAAVNELRLRGLLPDLGLTVAELRSALADAPADAQVLVGICDDEANERGGVFVAAEEVIRTPRSVQITGWARLK